MSRSKLISMLAVCPAIMFTASSAAAQGFTFISKKLLESRLSNPELTIIDVRSPGDWKSSQWKIRGALRESPAGVYQWMNHFSKDRRLVLYCAGRHEATSARVARELAAAVIKKVQVLSGIPAKRGEDRGGSQSLL